MKIKLKKINNFNIKNFIFRCFVWLFGFVIFMFALAFILAGNNGATTFNALFMPFRVIIGLSNPKDFAFYILIPASTFLCLVGLLLHYLRTKKIRIDYIISIASVILIGYVLAKIQKIPLLSDMLDKTKNMKFPFLDYPISLLFSILPIPFFAAGMGIMSGSKIVPNNFPIFVGEIARTTKMSYRKTQWIVDASFVLLGLLFMIISILIKRHDGDKPMEWSYITHYLGWTSVVAWIIQGHIIHKSRVYSEKIINIVAPKSSKKKFQII